MGAHRNKGRKKEGGVVRFQIDLGRHMQQLTNQHFHSKPHNSYQTFKTHRDSQVQGLGPVIHNSSLVYTIPTSSRMQRFCLTTVLYPHTHCVSRSPPTLTPYTQSGTPTHAQSDTNEQHPLPRCARRGKADRTTHTHRDRPTLCENELGEEAGKMEGERTER